MGGTMRLGSYPCSLTPDSNVMKAYGEATIEERHRHRYELNNSYLEQFEANGLRATGTNPESGLVEVVEISSHPWFVASQFHPEYSSTVESPHPLFVAFLSAALKKQQSPNKATAGKTENAEKSE